MYVITINGQQVDQPDGLSLTFVTKSSLFDFEKIELSRTQSFTLPLTPHNRELFGFPDDVAAGGGIVKVFNECIITTAVGQIVGNLIVTGVTPSAVTCSVVYGEMRTLKQLKAAGTIDKWLSVSEQVTLHSGIAYDCTPGVPLNVPRYNHDSPCRQPSVDLQWLINQACTQQGVNADANLAPTNSRLIIGSLNAPADNLFAVTQLIYSDGTIPMDAAVLPYFRPTYIEVFDEISRTYRGVWMLKAQQDVRIYMAGTLPPGGQYKWILKRGLDASQYEVSELMADVSELPGLRLPLPAEYQLSKGDAIAPVRYAEDSRGRRYVRGMDVTTAWDFQGFGLGGECEFVPTATGWSCGTWKLRDNLPQFTLNELLTLAVQSQGLALTWSESSRLFGWFDYNFDGTGSTKIDIESRLIEVAEVKRATPFGSHYHTLRLADKVTPLSGVGEQVAQATYYSNVMTAEDKVVNLGGGKVSAMSWSYTRNAYNRSAQGLGPWAYGIIGKGEVTEDGGVKPVAFDGVVLATEQVDSSGKPYLVPFEIGKNANLQKICELSTQVKVVVKMDDITFFRLTDYTRFSFRGGWWVAVEATYTAPRCTLVLQRYK